MGNTYRPSSADIITALDAWLYAYKLTVIAALIEFAVILRMKKIETYKKTSALPLVNSRIKTRKNRWLKFKAKDHFVSVDERCNQIDRLSFYAFTVLFLFFCFVYMVACFNLTSPVLDHIPDIN